MYDLPQDYLDLIREIFEPRYKRKLSDEEVQRIADNLINFGKVCENFFKKKPELLAKMKKKVRK